MNWFFGTSGTLILQPDETGKTYAGFYSGESLRLTAKSTDTIATVMANFNAYRSPDQQITQLWTTGGTPLPFTTLLGGKTVVAIVSRMDVV
jgi:hypothetical protein